MASKTKTVVISADELKGYPVGKATCTKVGGQAVIVYRAADGSVRVAPNSCAHSGAALSNCKDSDIEDAGKLVCSFHGAVLDPATMTYSKGPKFMAGVGNKVEAGTPHPTLAVTVNADGSASVEVPVGGGCSVA